MRLVEMSGGVTNRVATFVYDGYGCIARTAGGTTDRFVRDPSTGRPLAMVADGRAYLYAHDANGNVAALVDAVTGEVAARYAYAAFGATLMSEGPLARRNPFRFSSEYADDETGLIYYNWRHYDPVHGVWLGRDPIGVDGGANLYAFCGNRPMDRVDYNGAFSIKYLAWEQTSFLEKVFTGNSFKQRNIYSERDIPISRRNMNLNGLFSAAFGFEDSCNAQVLLKLSVNLYLDENVSVGERFRVVPHEGLQKGLSFSLNSDRKPPFGAVLSHEMGHAQAFFRVVKPRFESRIRMYLRKSSLNDNEKDYVKRIFTAVQKETEKESGEFATKLELLWYRNNGFLEKRVEDAYEFEKR